MTQLSFKNLLFSLVKQAKIDLEKRFLRANIAITPFQFTILKLAQQGLSQKEIAEKIGVQPPSLIPPIEQLVKKGFLQRKHDARDRRKLHAHLTATGKKLVAKTERDQPQDSLNQAFIKLTKTKQKQLLAILEELNNNFAK